MHEDTHTHKHRHARANAHPVAGPHTNVHESKERHGLSPDLVAGGGGASLGAGFDREDGGVGLDGTGVDGVGRPDGLDRDSVHDRPLTDLVDRDPFFAKHLRSCA